MPSELRPCPLCLGEVKWHTSEVAGEGGNVYHTHNLQCPVRVESLFRDDDERIIAAWNTRASDWQEITPENLPKWDAEDEIYGVSTYEGNSWKVVATVSKTHERWDYKDYLNAGWTHFRPINAPEPSGHRMRTGLPCIIGSGLPVVKL